MFKCFPCCYTHTQVSPTSLPLTNATYIRKGNVLLPTTTVSNSSDVQLRIIVVQDRASKIQAEIAKEKREIAAGYLD